MRVISVCYRVVGRRVGDLATVYAETGKAEKELGWTAKRSVDEACKDSWKWQSQNPRGYRTEETVSE